ncbi:MAG: serine/threonine protein kinase [bacterium]
MKPIAHPPGEPQLRQSFFSLSPDHVLNSVEEALQKEYPGLRTTGKSSALNSLENRVFEIEIEDEIQGERSIVAKFYRPGRWSQEQILEEHRFVQELKEAEIPVIAPLQELQKTDDGIYFVLFPKVRGRLKDELHPEELRQLGRFVGQIHTVGARFRSKYRNKLSLENYGRQSLETLLSSPFLNENIRPFYENVCLKLFEIIQVRMQNTYTQSIHGDCHVGNVLWNETGPFILDFDDMLVGPPVQDLWMISKGRSEEDLRLREDFLQGYEMMRDFDRSSLSLIEPLRALRMIHYSAWIARRWEDPSFPKMFTQFTTQQYWNEEIEALNEILEILNGY